MVGQSWYARNRLGVNQLCSICWGSPLAHKTSHVLITRVMKKCALLSVECVKHMICTVFGSALARREVDRIELIMDSGRHFASYTFLDMGLSHLVDRHRVNCTTTFGMPNHVKGPCDQTGGDLERMRQSYIQRKDKAVKTEHDLKECYEYETAEQVKVDPASERFVGVGVGYLFDAGWGYFFTQQGGQTTPNEKHSYIYKYIKEKCIYIYKYIKEKGRDAARRVPQHPLTTHTES